LKFKAESEMQKDFSKASVFWDSIKIIQNNSALIHFELFEIRATTVNSTVKL